MLRIAFLISVAILILAMAGCASVTTPTMAPMATMTAADTDVYAKNMALYTAAANDNVPLDAAARDAARTAFATFLTDAAAYAHTITNVDNPGGICSATSAYPAIRACGAAQEIALTAGAAYCYILIHATDMTVTTTEAYNCATQILTVATDEYTAANAAANAAAKTAADDAKLRHAVDAARAYSGKPTIAPTIAPTVAPTVSPTVAPTMAPTATIEPTMAPTVVPTATIEPTVAPAAAFAARDARVAARQSEDALLTPVQSDIGTYKKSVASILIESRDTFGRFPELMTHQGLTATEVKERIYDSPVWRAKVRQLATEMISQSHAVKNLTPPASMSAFHALEVEAYSNFASAGEALNMAMAQIESNNLLGVITSLDSAITFMGLGTDLIKRATVELARS